MLTKNVTYVFALALPLLGSGTALAQVACGNATCPRGFSCETETLGCPAIECVGDNCKPCEPSAYSYCKPLPCRSNDDCDTGMVCTGVQYEGCARAAEPSCDGPDCEASSSSNTCGQTAPTTECVPRWQLPCQTAADCGAGFTCEEVESCTCAGSSGGGSTPGSGIGGAAAKGSAANAAESCSCEKTGAKACKAIQVACTNDDDCVSGFSCKDNPNGVCSRSSSGETTCIPADPPKLCVPPYSDVGGSGRGVPTSNTGSSEGTHADAGADTPSASGGCTVANAGGPGGAASFFVVLGAMLGVARRRRR